MSETCFHRLHPAGVGEKQCQKVGEGYGWNCRTVNSTLASLHPQPPQVHIPRCSSLLSTPPRSLTWCAACPFLLLSLYTPFPPLPSTLCPAKSESLSGIPQIPQCFALSFTILTPLYSWATPRTLLFTPHFLLILQVPAQMPLPLGSLPRHPSHPLLDQVWALLRVPTAPCRFTSWAAMTDTCLSPTFRLKTAWQQGHICLIPLLHVEL